MAKQERPKAIHYDHGVVVYPEADKRGRHRIVYRDRNDQRKNVWRADLEDARADAAELARQLGDLRSGTSRGEDHSHRMFAELVDLYLNPATHDKWSISHERTQRELCRLWIVPVIGSRTCGSLTPDDMRAVLQRARKARLAAERTRAIGATLRAICTAGLDRGWLHRDPMRGVKYTPPRREQGQAAVYVPLEQRADIESVEALAKVAERLGEWWRGLEVRLAAYAGLRWGELHALRVDDINLDAGLISVDRQLLDTGGKLHVHLPKYAKVRETFLSESLAEPLAKRIAELEGEPGPDWPGCPPGCTDGVLPGTGGLLFPTATRWWPRRSRFASDHFRPAAEKAGWPKDPCGGCARHPDGLGRPDKDGKRERATHWRWTWHDLRHHFCTWCLASTESGGLGLEVADVAYFAGHATPDFTWKAYVSTRPGAIERARAATRRMRA